VQLPLVYLILPLTFHQRTARVLATKTQPGALYKALAEDREIVAGLQERMQAMHSRTSRALSIAFHSKLIEVDREGHFQLIPVRKSPPIGHVTEEVKTAISAAKRVGQALAEMSFVQLSTHLGVKF
jgi:hypothetical protein